jgi:serine/threonine protein kinase
MGEIRFKLSSPQELLFRRPVWNAVSGDAKDLLLKLLTVDYSNRPSAEQVQQHKWLRDNENPNQILAIATMSSSAGQKTHQKTSSGSEFLETNEVVEAL